MVELVGDIGFVVSGIALVTFGFMFLMTVRWWTDWLGRIIALVVFVIAFMMLLGLVRLLGLPLPGLFLWRAILFPLLAVGSVGANVVFIWAQFIAPRVRKRRSRVTSMEMTARRKE